MVLYTCRSAKRIDQFAVLPHVGLLAQPNQLGVRRNAPGPRCARCAQAAARVRRMVVTTRPRDSGRGGRDRAAGNGRGDEDVGVVRVSMVCPMKELMSRPCETSSAAFLRDFHVAQGDLISRF